eukprot:c4675_g1_i2.p1 GENE.c4675_g1_i2~~c4675_g1_i2.p1  ORF type:complete len:178 (-),score=20.10 c4675_g1_i2:248-781(-)
MMSSFCECGKPSKYTCPSCSARTCSLDCVRLHKKNTGCTGKRDRTSFLAIDQLNDTSLASDLRFLEDTKSVIESAKHDTTDNVHKRIPSHLYQLVTLAKSQGIHLLILPQGMERRMINTTTLNSKLKQINWHVEIEFSDIKHVVVKEKVIGFTLALNHHCRADFLFRLATAQNLMRF